MWSGKSQAATSTVANEGVQFEYYRNVLKRLLVLGVREREREEECGKGTVR